MNQTTANRWQLRNGGEVGFQSFILYSALVVTGIRLTLNPPQRKPPER
jgi:hypothetical protein